MRAETEELHSDEIWGLSEGDPPFSREEVTRVCSEFNPRKAPRGDGFTADICAHAQAIANKCLELAHFTRPWKVASVCILRKPDREDYTKPKSFRPIGLLSVLGKVLEKLLARRLCRHLLPNLNVQQYGFMPQRGAEDSLYGLMTHIRTRMVAKEIVVQVLLDIEGAFDNAWWPALKSQLVSKGCPRNLYGMVLSYLTDQRVELNYSGIQVSRDSSKGCVQGSILGI